MFEIDLGKRHSRTPRTPRESSSTSLIDKEKQWVDKFFT